MLRFFSFRRFVSLLFRPAAYLLRDLFPWLLKAFIGWLAERARETPRREAYCRDCPFRPSVPPEPAPPGAPDSSARSTLPLAPLLMFATLLAGCVPAGSYVAADRATFDAVAPEYSDYVREDAQLDADQRARRSRTIDAWRVRLEQAEAASLR